MNFPGSQFCVLIVIFKFMTHVIIWTRNFVSGTETRAVAHNYFVVKNFIIFDDQLKNVGFSAATDRLEPR